MQAISKEDKIKLEPSVATGCVDGSTPMVWYGMVEVCEGAPMAVIGWVLTDRHDLVPCQVSVTDIYHTIPYHTIPCAANSLHRGTISVSNIIGGTGTLGIA